MQTTRVARGFTLMEVMIVVAIIAILASIAYPSYLDQIGRSRRADAKAALLERAQWMERQFSVSGDYTKKADGSTLNAGALPALPAGTGALYTLNFPTGSPAANTFTLQLVPISNGAMANDKCGTLTVDNTGTRGASGITAGTVSYATCWEK